MEIPHAVILEMVTVTQPDLALVGGQIVVIAENRRPRVTFWYQPLIQHRFRTWRTLILSDLRTSTGQTANSTYLRHSYRERI